MQHELVIYFDSSDPRNSGWAYCLNGETSAALPHRRKDCGLVTLSRSVRRAFRGQPLAGVVARLTGCLRRDERGSRVADPTGWRAALLVAPPLGRGRPRKVARSRSRSSRELERRRIQLELSQGELADQIGCTARSISRWETGALPVPESIIQAVRYLSMQRGV